MQADIKHTDGLIIPSISEVSVLHTAPVSYGDHALAYHPELIPANDHRRFFIKADAHGLRVMCNCRKQAAVATPLREVGIDNRVLDQVQARRKLDASDFWRIVAPPEYDHRARHHHRSGACAGDDEALAIALIYDVMERTPPKKACHF